MVTRCDFDGLVCAVLLNELEIIEDIKFVHPKDIQDERIDITSRDITTNLPYVAAASLALTTINQKHYGIPATVITSDG